MYRAPTGIAAPAPAKEAAESGRTNHGIFIFSVAWVGGGGAAAVSLEPSFLAAMVAFCAALGLAELLGETTSMMFIMPRSS